MFNFFSLSGLPYRERYQSIEDCSSFTINNYYCFDEFLDDRLKIPLVREALRHGVLFPLEHLVILEVPVNEARVYNMSPKQCSGQSMDFLSRSTDTKTFNTLGYHRLFLLNLQKCRVRPLHGDREDLVGPGIPCHPADLYSSFI